jgi:DNA-nicking Smr family endonuclease
MTTPGAPPDDDDPLAFRRAVLDVRPLPGRPAAPDRPRPVPVARFTREERTQVLRESLDEAVDFAALDSGEHVAFRRPGVREDVLRRLRRGQYAVEAEADLHGLGRLAARDALRDFLADCVARRLRCVRIVHGKGRRSGPGGPVLKHAVNHWLRRYEDVLAFASARPMDGGTGAVYVLLAPARR